MGAGEAALQRAIERHRAGDPAGAERNAREALRADPRDLEATQLLAIAIFQQGRADEGIAAIERAAQAAPGNPNLAFNRGLMLAGAGRAADAAAAFRRTLELAPTHFPARFNLGRALLAQGDAPGAVAEFEAVHAHAPNEVDVIAALGVALAAAGRLAEAAERFAHAVRLAPRHAMACFHLGVAREQLGDPAGALEAYDWAIAADPRHVEARLNRADVLTALDRPAEARAALEAAVAVDPRAAPPRRRLGALLVRRSEFVAARAVWAGLLADDPRDVEALHGHAVTQFEPIYENEDAVAAARARYVAALDRLAATVRSLPGGPGAAAASAAAFLPFYLPYQHGDDDQALQKRFGDVVCDALAGDAPAVLPRPPRERLRLAVVGAYLHGSSVSKLVSEGWIDALDTGRFELMIYQLVRRDDAVVAAARTRADAFVAGLPDEAAWRRRLAEDAPDVVVFPEIGLHAPTARLAATRWAKLQLVARGHPFTSGLRTIDAFLSAELMEPGDGERHYTERLVRLPNLGIRYRPRLRVPVPLDRASLGLPADRPLFLCCQSLYKYLPRHDRLLVEIARGAPDAAFVFIEAAETPLTAPFRARLGDAFAAAGLAFDERVRFVRRLSPDEFEALAGLCDVYLDSLGWSGDNTTLECMARDLPIVAHDGPTLRGRHTAGILRRMGLGDRVAASEDAYVAAAVALARDPALRATEAAEIAARKARLFDDRAPIEALDEFMAREAGG